MEAGRKPQTFNPSENSSPWMASSVPWARSLKKNQLGGVIFGCTNDTLKECHSNQLFGLPAQHFLYVKNIEPGLPLFLFNYSERKLHGIYEAVSSGKMNIDSYAWTAGGLDRTRYPAQVQIRSRLQCQALTEIQFKSIIVDNYYSHSHFWFELDHAQASKLISKLSSLAVAPGPFVPKHIPKRTTETQWFPSDNKSRDYEKRTDNLSKSHDSVGTSATSDGSNEVVESPLCGKMVENDEVGLMFEKLKELARSQEYADANLVGNLVEVESKDDVDLEQDTLDIALRKANSENSYDINDYPTIIAKLCHEVEELNSFKQEQTRKMKSLEMKLAEAQQEIYQLENRCMMLESISNPGTTVGAEESPDEIQLNLENRCMMLESLSYTNTTLVADVESKANPNMTLVADEEPPEEFHLNLDESIFIVGGYDGKTCSSALQLFSPSDDVLRSLKSMSCVRSHASVAELNGQLYVFGGGSGSTWYDTVESYNVENNQWTLLPSMNAKKGSLAGAALNGKVFAVGGGNSVEPLSDLEMFDLDVGRWITARSMLQKRFAVAAVELNGALYAVGGYDGDNYLKSAERFDPREHSWARIGSMDTKRGCHSLVVLNEKIYALGGYDGETRVPSVEIYEPRVETWIPGEPMNQGRGYLCAAVVKESIYVLGGVKPDEELVDMVECYKDGEGWQATNLRALGKRCFASAIVLGGN